MGDSEHLLTRQLFGSSSVAREAPTSVVKGVESLNELTELTSEFDQSCIDEHPCYATVRGGNGRPATHLELYNVQGQLRSFDYANISGVSSNDPGKVLIHYDGRESYTLILEGRNMKGRLLDELVRSRLLWVREMDSLHAQTVPSGETVVTNIRIEPGFTPRGW